MYTWSKKNSSTKIDSARFSPMLTRNGRWDNKSPVLQRELVDGVQCYDERGYVCWKMDEDVWHLTRPSSPKQTERHAWHATNENTGMHYWFVYDNTVESLDPTPVITGVKKGDVKSSLHKPLSQAPQDVRNLITNHMPDLMRVNEDAPRGWRYD